MSAGAARGLIIGFVTCGSGMKKLILTSILMFISAFAFSGTVTVNGNSCGSLTSAIVGAEGNLEVKTTATCGGVVVPPPPPEPDPLRLCSFVDADLPLSPVAEHLARVNVDSEWATDFD
jgi:hypothetical protein